jgi:mannose-6-phosphate isomerase-like protein (cupin superfamily)
MRNNTVAVVGMIGMLGLSGAILQGQQAGQRAGGAAAVADAPTNKTAFWTNDDIQARWKDNEARHVINSRLFNGPTNISANVRIVADDDPPLTHDTTADLWIMTAGTATAITDGELAEGGKSIRNPVKRTVHAGDILYIPPSVPHHFADNKGFRALLIRFDTIRSPQAGQRATAAAQPAGQRGERGGAAAVPDAPPNKTSFWTNDDIQARWKDNEAKHVINSRLFNGPTNISANVRIVADDDPPLTHDTTADLWIMTAGTATAITDSELAEGGKSIRNPVNRPVHAGDILYIPPGVAHHFADDKGFRALLIRFDTK